MDCLLPITRIIDTDVINPRKDEKVNYLDIKFAEPFYQPRSSAIAPESDAYKTRVIGLKWHLWGSMARIYPPKTS